MTSVANYIALRYIRGSRRQRFASFIALLAALGITVGVCALIVVSSIMQGLQDRLKDNILSDTAHLVVQADSADPAVAASLLSLPYVTALVPYVEGEALAQSAKDLAIVTLQGSDYSHMQKLNAQGELETFDLNALPFRAQEIYGSAFNFEPGKFSLAANLATQARLSLRFSDASNKVRIISTKNARYTPLGLTPVQRNFTLTNTLIHMDTSSAPSVLAHYSDVRRFFRLPQDEIYTRLYLSDPFLIESVVAALPSDLAYTDWRGRYGEFFKAVGLEKLTMTLMLCLIVLVAAFNILSSLTMIISSRLNEIAILKTMGMTKGQLLSLFLMVGMSASVIGSFFGVLFGIPLALNAQSLLDMVGISILQGDLPVKIDVANIALILLLCFVFSMLCTLYPALYASRLDPVKNLVHQ